MTDRKPRISLWIVFGATIAITLGYAGLGALVDMTNPYDGWIKDLRDAGLLKPRDADDTARVQEALAHLLLWVTPLYCTPLGLMRPVWMRVVLLLWPPVAFLAPFLAGYAETNETFWIVILTAMFAPLVAIFFGD